MPNRHMNRLIKNKLPQPIYKINTYGLLYFLLDAFGGGGVLDRLRLWPRDIAAGLGAGSRDPLRVLERLLWKHPSGIFFNNYRTIRRQNKTHAAGMRHGRDKLKLNIVPLDPTFCPTWWIQRIKRRQNVFNLFLNV